MGLWVTASREPRTARTWVLTQHLDLVAQPSTKSQPMETNGWLQAFFGAFWGRIT